MMCQESSLAHQTTGNYRYFSRILSHSLAFSHTYFPNYCRDDDKGPLHVTLVSQETRGWSGTFPVNILTRSSLGVTEDISLSQTCFLLLFEDSESRE